ncbi:MAG TPA: hypothetical protein PLT34_06665 [Muribaculaceae bacterium]|nr:hypothetical protein [Muribaculaceae bacterium]
MRGALGWLSYWFPYWLQSASSRRQGLMGWLSGDTYGVPGYYKSASFRRPTLVWWGFTGTPGVPVNQLLAKSWT